MLDGTTAFVTGASQGIGREIALTLSSYGADVALAARSDGIYETAELAGEVDGDGETLPVETDVTDEASVESAIDETVETFGGLDCLVNNAGIAGPVEPVERIDADDWERVQAVNVQGVFHCVKHAADHLRESENGSICNIASVGGKRPYPNRSAYAASKMALVGFTRTLAFEFGNDGVRANVICPGAVQGPRIERALEAQAELAEEGVRTTSIDPDQVALDELFVEAEDVAEMAAFLASEKADHVTGQDLNVDSGITWY